MPASFARRRASGDEKMRFDPAGRASPLAAAGDGRRLGVASRGRRLSASATTGAVRPRWSLLPVRCARRRRRSGQHFRNRAFLGGRRRRRHVLSLLRQHRDQLVDGDVLRAFRHHDLGERAFVDRLVFHGRLVGLDLGDHVTRLDLVALLLEPPGEVALLHGGRQRGHEDVDRHGGFLTDWSS